jgi:transposase
MVGVDNPVRQIDRLVDAADTSYFEKAETKDIGRRPFNPKDMLKLFLYGYENNVHSSRKLDRECKRNVEVMWLMRGLKPDDRTICNFRKENVQNIIRFFNEFCVTLVRAGYIDGRLMSIDGTKVRANNGKRNNFSKKKLKGLIERIENKINEYLQELDKNDEIEVLQKRKEEYEGYLERIEKGEVTEVSTTDSDSRMMKESNGGSNVCFNVQAVVDSKNKLIAGVAVTNHPNDQGQLYPVISKVKDNLRIDEISVAGDKGYHKTEDFKDCEDNGITTYVAKPNNNHDQEGKFKKEAFIYLPEEDAFLCPAGKKLKGSKPDEKGYKRYRSHKACKNCPVKKKCTTGQRKDLGRHQYADYAERNDNRINEYPEIYQQRQQLSEHPFGTMKRTMGIRQFLTRGLINVTAESALAYLVYNLKRLRNIHKFNNPQETDLLALYTVFITLYPILSIITLSARQSMPCTQITKM